MLNQVHDAIVAAVGQTLGWLIDPILDSLPSSTAVWQFLTATDERTWVGHGLQGLLFGFVGGLTRPGNGAIFTFGAFLHREANDYFKWLRQAQMLRELGYPQTAAVMERNRRKKLIDGYMDLWSPMAGALLGEFLAQLIRP